jgi:uncharacterized protein YybS (DUF2232 family)
MGIHQVALVGKFFLAVAGSVLIFSVSVRIPPAGLVLLPFVTFPVLTFGFRSGRGAGLSVLVAAMALLGVIAGLDLSLIYAPFAVMGGLLFALLGRVQAIEILVAGIAAAMLAVTGGVMLYFFGSWVSMMDQFRESVTQQLTSAMRVHEKMGLSQESLELLKERAPQIAGAMIELLPALLFISLGFAVLINILFLCRRFPERRSGWLSVDLFREWKGPDSLVWGLIACGFVLLVPGLELARILAVNLLLIIGASYFAQGLAVIAFFYHKNNVPRFLRAITYVLILFQQIFTLLVVGLGLFDLWGDFRRLKKNNLTPSRAN